MFYSYRTGRRSAASTTSGARESCERHQTGRAGDDYNYHVSIDVAALRPGVRALPSLQIIGDRFADEVATGPLTDPLAALTPREAEIARLMVAGRSRPRIAADLDITENTVREFGRRIYRKLGVKSRVELVTRVRGGS
jgi:DNA-binding CsgD family transcriptional regulator